MPPRAEWLLCLGEEDQTSSKPSRGGRRRKGKETQPSMCTYIYIYICIIYVLYIYIYIYIYSRR